MKTIKYSMCTKVNVGTDTAPKYVENFSEVEMPFTPENAAIAQREAYNGEFSIYDDGKAAVPTTEERLAAMEAAMLELLGVNGNG